MFEKLASIIRPGFKLDSGEGAVRTLTPQSGSHRYEGIAFSTSGDIIAVATADANAVVLYRRNPDGQFSDTSFCMIEGPETGLNYPHDVAFARTRSGELLAVANRTGAISVWEDGQSNGTFGTDPVFEISGTQAKLDFSDGLVFIPPGNDLVAACNLEEGTITFYLKTSSEPVRFALEPVFTLRHDSISRPDGVAVSSDGRWLAVANHGNHTVCVFERTSGRSPASGIRYGPAPAAILKDDALKHPHSVAFTPGGDHIVVTNAGANNFSVFARQPWFSGKLWSAAPVVSHPVNDQEVFKEVNMDNKKEGGPKGIAIHKNTIAVCSPECGVKIFSFTEGWSLFTGVRAGLRRWKFLEQQAAA